MRSLLPSAERLGVATADEVEIDTLADRLREEATEANASVIPALLIGACTRVIEKAAPEQPKHHA